MPGSNFPGPAALTKFQGLRRCEISRACGADKTWRACDAGKLNLEIPRPFMSRVGSRYFPSDLTQTSGAERWDFGVL